MSKDVVIIKLGGSAITNKKRFKTPRLDIIEQLAEEISSIYRELERRLVIIHGGGSYGHPLASKFQLHKGIKDFSSILGVSETIDAMRELSLIISSTLRKHKVPVVPIQPSAIVINKNSKIHRISTETIRRFLEIDMVPLLWGDVVYDVEQGASIVSGDELVSYIAEEFNAEMVVYGSNVDGIYKDPESKRELIKIINSENLKDVLNYITDTKEIDVTGGMWKKVKEILKVFEKGIPIYLVNATKKGLIYETIKTGKVFGTLFHKHAKMGVKI